MKLRTLTFAASLATALLVACAADPALQTGAIPEPQAGATPAGDGDELICTREYPTGTNIPIKKCRTRAQIEAERAASAESLRRAQTGGPNAKMGQ